MKVSFRGNNKKFDISQGHFENGHWFILEVGEKCELADQCSAEVRNPDVCKRDTEDCDCGLCWGGCDAADGVERKENHFCSYIRPC